MRPQKSKRKEICERSKQATEKKLKIIAEEILDFLDVGVWTWFLHCKNAAMLHN